MSRIFKSTYHKVLNQTVNDYKISFHTIYNDLMEEEIFLGEIVKIDESFIVLNQSDIFLFNDVANNKILARCKVLDYDLVKLVFSNKKYESKVFHISELQLIGRVVS